MILFTTCNSVPDKIGNKHIKHLLKLDVSLDPTVTPYELYLFLELLEVDIAAPAASHEHPYSTPVSLNGLINFKPVTDQVKEDEHEN